MNKLVAILCITVWMLASCAQPKDLVYQGVQNFKIRSVGFSKTELGADIKFYNPNSYPMMLKDANADVFVNNKFIGKVLLNETFTIPRRDTFLLPVSLNADMGGILGNLAQALSNKEVMLKFTGSVKAGRNGIFVNVPVNYEGKQKLNINF